MHRFTLKKFSALQNVLLLHKGSNIILFFVRLQRNWYVYMYELTIYQCDLLKLQVP